MKIAAVLMVRNEAAIIADSLGHLLHNLKVDRLLVADNDSSDATPAILRRIAARDSRVFVESVPGPNRQPEVLTRLFHQAVAWGADWVLPQDADEFLWLGPVVLQALCAAASAEQAGFWVPVRNFVQLRLPGVGSIRTLCFSACPQGTMEEAHALVDHGDLPFLWMNYPPKLLLRARAGLVLHRGQHGADGLSGALALLPCGEFLHAPILSSGAMRRRQANGYRARSATTDPNVSWHIKRLTAMDPAALKREWRANSVTPLRLLHQSVAGAKDPLVRDTRLVQIAWRLRAFRRETLRGLSVRPSRTVCA